MDKKQIFRDFFVYSLGDYISQALGMLNGFLLRAFLEPYYMGIWQGFNIIKDYTSYTNLGVSRSAAREIAYFRGKKDEAKTEVLKNTGFSFSALTIFPIGIGCIIFALIRRPYINNYLYWGFISIGIIVVLERLESYIVTILRAKKKFFVESLVKVINALLNLALIVLIVRNFKLFGLYAMHIAVFICSIFLLVLFSKERFLFFMKIKELKSLIKIGFPLVLMGVMFVNLTNIDRIVILKMLGATQLGLYSIALMIGHAIYNISNMAGIILYPRFQEIYGKTDNKKQVYAAVSKTIKTLSFPLAVLILGALIVSPYLIRLFIPKYIYGITAMKIFICGMFFLSLAKFFNQFLVTVNRQWLTLYICTSVVLLNLGLNIFFVKVGFGIEGVAAATSISHLVYFMLMFSFSFAEAR